MSKKKAVKWDQLSDDALKAGQQYLTLHVSTVDTIGVKDLWIKTDDTLYYPDDILRAAELKELPIAHPKVRAMMEHMERGHVLDHILLVRMHGRLIVARGYHLLCALRFFDRTAQARCRIVTLH